MIFWSLKGKKNWGSAYWGSKSASIFINNIYQDSEDYPSFLDNLLFVYFHEYLHLFLKFKEGKWMNSCKTVINPLAIKLVEAVVDEELSMQMVNDYWDVYKSYDTEVNNHDEIHQS